MVLTPNGRELAGLLGDDSREGDDAVRAVAERYGAVVSSRGVVAAPDGRSWIDEAGGIGLGTSGSGDRLTTRPGRVGFLARELLDELPLVLTALQARAGPYPGDGY